MSTHSPSPKRFEEIVLQHQATVFRTLHRLTGAGDHIQDLAQEVFLRLFRAIPEFRGDALLSTYLYRITFNVAQDEWKRRRRDREHRISQPAADEGEPERWLENLSSGDMEAEHLRSPEQLLLTAELQEIVEQSLGGLSLVERTVLTLYHGESVSYEAIAEVLNLPLNTVRTYLHRGRKRLAALVQQRLAPPAHPITQAVPTRTR